MSESEILEKLEEIKKAVFELLALQKSNNSLPATKEKEDNMFTAEGWIAVEVPFNEEIREAFKKFCKENEKIRYWFDRENKQWYVKTEDPFLLTAVRAILGTGGKE